MKWYIGFNVERSLLFVETSGVYSVDSGRRMTDDIIAIRNGNPV